MLSLWKLRQGPDNNRMESANATLLIMMLEGLEQTATMRPLVRRLLHSVVDSRTNKDVCRNNAVNTNGKDRADNGTKATIGKESVDATNSSARTGVGRFGFGGGNGNWEKVLVSVNNWYAAGSRCGERSSRDPPGAWKMLSEYLGQKT
ncbi:UNVERIFIED_CONTAM: hypothetical protein PYX00_009527 [Menopon gallinae]|uniref:Uncharacterized protein n=1 Tax=Menopon gallinae TaxID=328185 RepID=A0AAW2HB86_9NEOP